jgi:hypothetical protein
MTDAQICEVGGSYDDVIAGDVRLNAYKSWTARRIFIKFGVDFMPPEATPKPYFFNFLQSVLPTRRTIELVKWEDNSSGWRHYPRPCAMTSSPVMMPSRWCKSEENK